MRARHLGRIARKRHARNRCARARAIFTFEMVSVQLFCLLCAHIAVAQRQRWALIDPAAAAAEALPTKLMRAWDVARARNCCLRSPRNIAAHLVAPKNIDESIDATLWRACACACARTNRCEQANASRPEIGGNKIGGAQVRWQRARASTQSASSSSCACRLSAQNTQCAASSLIVRRRRCC